MNRPVIEGSGWAKCSIISSNRRDLGRNSRDMGRNRRDLDRNRRDLSRRKEISDGNE